MLSLFILAILGIFIVQPDFYIDHFSFRRVRTINELAFVGLGRMGRGMAGLLASRGFQVTGFDLSSDTRDVYASEGGKTAGSLREAVSKMTGRKVVWLMIPHQTPDSRKPVDDSIAEIVDLLKPGDIIIDGGNSNYKDSIRRAEELKAKGVYFVDVGTSGGSRAAEGRGMCMMVGCEEEVYKTIEPILRALAWTDDAGNPVGYGRVGPPGAGHFVKTTVHNGAVEYPFFQGLVEGIGILAQCLNWDTDALSAAMEEAQGSSLRSWAVELAQEVFANREQFEGIGPQVGGGTYGIWGQEAASEFGVATPVLDASLAARRNSSDLLPCQPAAFAARVLAGIRFYMGGHSYKELSEPVTSEDLLNTLGNAYGVVDDTPEEITDKVIDAVCFVWLAALKEGYQLMAESPFKFSPQDLAEINRIWTGGGVVRSRLVELGSQFLSEGKSVDEVITAIEKEVGIDMSAVRYIQDIAKRLRIPTPALDAALSTLPTE